MRGWYYISFSDRSGFTYAIFVQGQTVADCLALVNRNYSTMHLGDYALCIPFRDEQIADIADADRLRLLSKQDMLRIWPDSIN